MKLLLFLLRTSPKTTILISLAGFATGAASAALIALINAALHHANGLSGLLVVGVVGVGLVKVLSGMLSQWLLVRFSQETVLSIAIDLCRKVLTAPFEGLERTGQHRILTVLTEDVAVLAAAVQSVPNLITNGAVVLGCSVYLVWLYPLGFVALLVLIGAGAAIYTVLHKAAFRAIVQAREGRDRLMGSVRAMIDGIKELKMHKHRRDRFVSERIEATSLELRDLNLAMIKRYMFVDAWNQVLFYLMIGGVLFAFPRKNDASIEVLTGYIFSAMYMMTPVWAIISSLPTFFRGQVSLAKLQELGVSPSLMSEPATRAERELPAVLRSPTLEFRGVEFHYSEKSKYDYDFSLGPVDLTLHPGELVFVVGGNGSGKSTLVRILTGLYSPHAGEIRLGGTVIEDVNLEWYRQHFSTVFSDFYLFDTLLGPAEMDVDAVATEYLRKLELDHKVSVVDGKLSTTHLSQGQRKRLALLAAVIQERPINIFDEWAAEQDPHYKEIFYSVLLPALKASGRTVVVVTHDDRYFHQGDRIIKLEDGKLVPTEQPRAFANAASIRARISPV